MVTLRESFHRTTSHSVIWENKHCLLNSDTLTSGPKDRTPGLPGSDKKDTSVGEPEYISVGERFSENRRTPKLENISVGEPENTSVGEPENISVGEPEKISVGERFSKNRRTPQLENRRTSPCFPSFPCSPCSPRAPNLLHVLPFGMVGWNDFCTPGFWIICRG